MAIVPYATSPPLGGRGKGRTAVRAACLSGQICQVAKNVNYNLNFVLIWQLCCVYASVPLNLAHYFIPVIILGTLPVLHGQRET